MRTYISNLSSYVRTYVHRKRTFYARFIRSRIRLWWYRLWIRKDEFHPSLTPDLDALMTMNKEQRDAYWADLARRRAIAHNRS